MIVKQLIEVFDTLDSADASGLKVRSIWNPRAQPTSR